MDKNLGDEGRRKKKTLNDWLWTILIVVLVIAIGIFAVNQSLSYFYKTAFLQNPCELCLDLNPHLDNCFNQEASRPQPLYNISIP